MSQQIVINTQFGGFDLSDAAIERLAELKGWNLIKERTGLALTTEYDYYFDEVEDRNLFLNHDIDRDDPALVQTVQELGEQSNTQLSTLRVVEIPDNVDWEIEGFNGVEWIAEKHRTWM